MATIKDVAELAGVSVGTVSHVIAGTVNVSPATRARVEAAIRRLRYRPDPIARSLKSRKSRMIGMIVSDLTNPFFPEMVRGAEDAALKRGYFLSTYNTDDAPERERQIFELFETWRADGMLVVTALRRGTHPHIRRALRAGTPVVCLDRHPVDVPVDTVTVDNAAAVDEAVSYLISTGCRRIAFIGKAPSMYVAPERIRGYRRAMRRAGLATEEYPGDFRMPLARKSVLRLLGKQPPPDAIFTGNIMMAAGALQALRETGLRCPDDISLATFDYVELLQSFGLRLTCVAQPSYQIGFEGANLLIDRMEGKLRSSSPRHIVLPCELRIGESTPMRRPGQPVPPSAG